MRIASLLLLLICATLPVAADVKVEHESGIDFTSYKSYAWHKGTDAARADVQGWVVAGVERELNAAGLRLVTEGPADLFVVTNTFADMQGGVSAAYFNAARYDVSLLRADIVMKTKGVLLVDLIDGAADRSVWRGMASELMQDPDAEELRRKVDKVLKKMFKDFPPR